MALTGSERNAISRALARGGAAAVARVKQGRYRVASSSRVGRFHTVTVDQRGAYRCDCEAGLAGRICWAMAAVYIAKVERGGGRVTGPASPALAAERPADVLPLQRAA